MTEKPQDQPDYETVEDLEAPADSQDEVAGGRMPWCPTLVDSPSGPTGAQAC